MSKNIPKFAAKSPPKKLLNLNTQGTGKVGGGGPSKKILASQKREEAHIQELEVKAFDHSNEQSKDAKTVDNDAPEELVSLQAGQVGNHIGASFWEVDQEDDEIYYSDSSYDFSDFSDHGVLEEAEEEDVDINSEDYKREEEEEDEEEED